MAACIKMPLGTEVGLGPDHIVLDGDPGPHSLKRGQTAGRIDVPLGTERATLHGDPAPPSAKGGTQPPPPISGSCLLWQNGCMDRDATW